MIPSASGVGRMLICHRIISPALPTRRTGPGCLCWPPSFIIADYRRFVKQKNASPEGKAFCADDAYQSDTYGISAIVRARLMAVDS